MRTLRAVAAVLAATRPPGEGDGEDGEEWEDGPAGCGCQDTVPGLIVAHRCELRCGGCGAVWHGGPARRWRSR